MWIVQEIWLNLLQLNEVNQIIWKIKGIKYMHATVQNIVLTNKSIQEMLIVRIFTISKISTLNSVGGLITCLKLTNSPFNMHTKYKFQDRDFM